MNKRYLSFFILVFLFTACKKYKEGPFISLRTKTKRASGNWIFSNDTANILWSLSEDNIFNENIYLQTGDTTHRFGSWKFDDDKNNIKITWINNTVNKSNIAGDDSTQSTHPLLTMKYEIIQLRNDKLWLTDENEREYKFNSD